MLLLSSLYLAELCGLAIVFTLYRVSGRQDLLGFVSSLNGILFLTSALGFVLAGGVIAHQLAKSVRTGTRRQSLLVLVMNLVVVLLIVGTGEIALRLFSIKTPTGVTINGKRLHPRIWTGSCRTSCGCRQEGRHPAEAFLVFDELMGWTIGPSCESADKLYVSSADGLRSHIRGFAVQRSTGFVPNCCYRGLVYLW